MFDKFEAQIADCATNSHYLHSPPLFSVLAYIETKREVFRSKTNPPSVSVALGFGVPNPGADARPFPEQEEQSGRFTTPFLDNLEAFNTAYHNFALEFTR